MGILHRGSSAFRIYQYCPDCRRVTLGGLIELRSFGGWISAFVPQRLLPSAYFACVSCGILSPLDPSPEFRTPEPDSSR